MALDREETMILREFNKRFRINGKIDKHQLGVAGKKLDVSLIPTFCDFLNQAIGYDYGNRGELLKTSSLVKNAIFIQFENPKAAGIDTDINRANELNAAYWALILAEAQNRQLDSYLLYLEKNRAPMDKFYQPVRRKFREFGLSQAMQGMIDDEYDILCISMPPGTRKTTYEKFFNSAVIGWFPKDYNLFYSHSSDITRMYYDGVYQIVTDEKEYTWHEIFPHLSVTGTNAKMQQFNIGAYKPFPSLQCTSIGSNNAGKVRASKFLLVDDLVAGIEEALNKVQLDKIWNAYAVDARQRKTNDTNGHFCKEIHIATRWSVHDVIGRVERAYEGNPRVKVIAVPATTIDATTGNEKSNFDYDYGGFTVENFRDQKLIMDEISYNCLYMQRPVEREGLLYHDDELQRYLSLPEGEPDAIIGICDTKSKGTDYMFLPCMYQYGDLYYCDSCICDDSSDFKTQYARLARIILDNDMQHVEFESNAGGDRIAYEINQRVQAEQGRCTITQHPTETNKETRIIVNSDWVKKHILFKDKSLYTPNDDYGKMISFLLGYSVSGKNPHDDVPDGLAIFSEFVTTRLYRRNRSARIIKSPI